MRNAGKRFERARFAFSKARLAAFMPKESRDGSSSIPRGTHNSSWPRGSRETETTGHDAMCAAYQPHPSPIYLCLPHRLFARAVELSLHVATTIERRAPPGPRGVREKSPSIGEQIARPCPIGKSTSCVPRSRVLRYLLTSYLPTAARGIAGDDS